MSDTNEQAGNSRQSFSRLLKAALTTGPAGARYLDDIRVDLIPGTTGETKDLRFKEALRLVHTLKRQYGHLPAWQEIVDKASIPDLPIREGYGAAQCFTDHVFTVFRDRFTPAAAAIGAAAKVSDIEAARAQLDSLDSILRRAESRSVDGLDVSSEEDIKALMLRGSCYTTSQRRIVSAAPFPSLEDHFRLVPNDLISIVGRAGVGKTTTACTFSDILAQEGNRILLVSPEMTSGVLYANCFAAHHGRGTFSTSGDEPATEVVDAVEANPQNYTMQYSTGGNLIIVGVDMLHSKKISDLAALIEKFDPSVIVVDSAYMFDPQTGSRRDVKGFEMMQMRTSQFHELAKQYGLPVVTIWQSNRESMESVKKNAKNAKSGKATNRVDNAAEAMGVYGGDALLHESAILIMLTPIAYDVNRMVLTKTRYGREGKEAYYAVITTTNGRYVQEADRDDVVALMDLASSGYAA